MINAIIVDTSAFVAEQCDFMGLWSAMLPSFFSVLAEQKIEILSHPILDGEIMKHIGSSMLIDKLAHLRKALTRYKDILPLINISSDDTIGKIDALNLESQMGASYKGFYEKATILPFSKPEVIFAQYFSNHPPFSETGEKKYEFPDAFVIEAIKQYLLVQTSASILVVSDDEDWDKALSDVPRISFAKSIEEGMKILQGSKNVESIFESVKADIEKEILWKAECESYELNIIEEMEDDIEITSVEVVEVSDDIIPLKITKNSVLLRTYATLKLSGSASIVDESRTYWDKEEKRYLFVAYIGMSFDNGEAEVECEVLITFDFDDAEDYVADASVESVKLNVKYNIEIEIDEDNIVYSDPDQDILADR